MAWRISETIAVCTRGWNYTHSGGKKRQKLPRKIGGNVLKTRAAFSLVINDFSVCLLTPSPVPFSSLLPALGSDDCCSLPNSHFPQEDDMAGLQ